MQGFNLSFLFLLVDAASYPEQVKSKMDKVAGARMDQLGVAADRADDAQPFFWPPFQLSATFPPPALLADLPSRAKLVK